MLVEEVFLQQFFESCDGLGKLGGGWHPIPTERSGEGEDLGKWFCPSL